MMDAEYELDDELNKESLIALKDDEDKYLKLFDQDYLSSVSLEDTDPELTIDEFLNLNN